MAKTKVNIKLVTVKGKSFTVTSIDHAEKILLSKNNAKGLIKLDDEKFELTKNGLRKKSIKGDNTESSQQK